MANPARAEVDLTLGDVTHKLRLTYEAIAEIEDTCSSLFDLSQRLSEGKIKLSELSVVLAAAANAVRREEKQSLLSVKYFGELLLEHGIPSALRPINTLFLRAFLSAKQRAELNQAQEAEAGKAAGTVTDPAPASTGTTT
jgi:hypothetical protein